MWKRPFGLKKGGCEKWDIDIFAACGRSFSTLMSGNQQLSLSGFSSGTLTITAWIEPV